MANEEQVVNSTTQLMEPQETAEPQEHVVTEAPLDEGGSDNMSLSELTTQLLAQDEEQGKGEAEAVEQTIAEEEPTQSTEPDAQQAGLVAQTDEGENDKKVILDRLGIDLDTLGEDEAMSLGRALRTESLKRFGRLTAQKREAESQIKELESKAESVQQQVPAQAEREDPLSDVWTAESLQKKEEELQSIEDWAEDALQLEANYDDDGEEYLVEVDNKRYTKQELLGIRANARKMLRKGGSLSERQNFLDQRQQFDGQALQYFPWMSDESSSEFGEYQQFVGQDKYKKLLDAIPEANLFAGLLVEGNLRVRDRLKAANNGTNGQAPKERPIAPAVTASAAPRRSPSSDGSRIQQAVKQAQKSFEDTGSIQSLARLRELQAQVS